MDSVPPEYDAAFIAALDLFKFAALLHAEIKQRAEVSVDSGLIEFLFRLLLGLPV